MKKKLVIIVGGGVFQVPAIREAKALGLDVFVLDMDENAPGFEFADHKGIVSTKDIEKAILCVKEYADSFNIVGVFTAGTDAAFTVANIAAELGLPGVEPENAFKATDKFKMREALKKGGVPHPAFALARNYEEARDRAIELGYPLVIKPVDNMGARGVRRIDSDKELLAQFKKSISFSGSYSDPAVILEHYMSGAEISMDTLVDENGDVHLLTVADRHIVGEPYFIEIGHSVPSQLSEIELLDAFNVMKKAITRGAAKADIKITQEGAKIGEITARLSGGFHSQCTDPLATGMNSTRAALKLALGEGLDKELITPKHNYAAIERAILPEAGKIKEIKGIEEAKQVPGIFDVILNGKEGDVIEPLTSNIGKFGHIIAYGKTREEAEKAYKKAKACLSFVYGSTQVISHCERK